MHRVSNVRPDERLGDCAACGPDVKVKFRRHRNHWACMTSQGRRTPEGRARNARRSSQSKRERRVPGMTEERFDAMFAAQSGVCGICGGINRSGRRLAADHCHATGLIRGLLCDTCNRGIGFMRDDPELLLRAIDYINTPRSA